MKGALRLYRLLCLAMGMTAFMQTASAAFNEYQPYILPTVNPGSYNEIKKVVVEGASGDPRENIHANLEKAICGGWDFQRGVNGVFGQSESLCGRADTQPIQARCEDENGNVWIKTRPQEWKMNGAGNGIDDQMMETISKKTIPDQGLISQVRGVPGRDTVRAFGNLASGLGERRGEGGTAKDLKYDIAFHQRIETGTSSGFDYPSDQDTVCGFQTLCRTPNAPDAFDPGRQSPSLLCPHPCQRPLGSPGKPQNWDENDSSALRCDLQKADEDGIKYACGGGETKGPGEDFCGELRRNGTKGGLCQDLNALVYVRWERIEQCGDDTIVHTKKGVCGFAKEVNDPSDEEYQRMVDNNFEPVGLFECCSDLPAATIDEGKNCIPCFGDECRRNPKTQVAIATDEWWSGNDCGYPEIDMREREYVSFFRAYTDASYERAPLPLAKDDDNTKANIPVACYGFYDSAPEDAQLTQTEPEDKRCVIAAYYDGNDGDGDKINFRSMWKTQQGKGAFRNTFSDNPFGNIQRSFEPEKSLWFPELGGAFSLLNDKVFGDRYRGDFSFALLATDSAVQRATVQLSPEQPLSSGAFLRTPDDTVTMENDPASDRRTMVEWWHNVETQMHKNFTPPKVRLLLPTVWSVDINPFDPLFTPKLASPDDRSLDIRSETIDIQVQATEDLLGNVAAFLERTLLLRMEEESVPVVVPIVNPTEIRAIAQGWEVWAIKQESSGKPGAEKAREVARKLKTYADRADEVRALRGELPRYAGALLKEQKKVSVKIATWLEENMDAYQTYLFFDWGTSLLQNMWIATQGSYRQAHDATAFPWCRMDDFTSPIYSLLDPWLPGRSENGDVTGGFWPYLGCLEDLRGFDFGSCGQNGENALQCLARSFPRCNRDMSLFSAYFDCLSLVSLPRDGYAPDAIPKESCEQFFPLPPAFPDLPNTTVDRDLILDFTAFRETKRSVKIPVLKPVQIKVDFARIRPPGLEQDEEPVYPDLAPLPAFPTGFAEKITAALPQIITPIGGDFDLFKEAAVIGTKDDDVKDPFPRIALPSVDLLSLTAFLTKTYYLVEAMAKENEKFWGSLTKRQCSPGEEQNPACVRRGTEQDCILPNDDPKGRCVHFEADLKERLQRIGARPAIFLKDDFRSLGSARLPSAHGQAYCERKDWACQLLNGSAEKPREGWMLDTTESYDTEQLLQDVRNAMVEKSGNVIENDAERFLYDSNQDQMFENFFVPANIPLDPYDP